jgi:hypothetical protein
MVILLVAATLMPFHSIGKTKPADCSKTFSNPHAAAAGAPREQQDK